MDTSAASAPKQQASGSFTAAIGVAIAIVAIIFAFNSAWYAHWFALFRAVHVMFAVFWVGGGLLLTTLALFAERRRDPQEMAMIARQAAFVGERLFAPAGVVVLAMGIAMMVNGEGGLLQWGKFWVIAGLIGYAATFTVGITLLGPMAKRISRFLEEKGPEAPETQEAIAKILLIARIDIAVLLLVVADMVTKPFS